MILNVTQSFIRFLKGHTEFPEDEEKLLHALNMYVFTIMLNIFLTVLSRMADDMKIQIPNSLTQRLSTKKGLLATIKNIFYLAVTISPLLALCSKSYGGYTFRRDLMLAVSNN